MQANTFASKSVPQAESAASALRARSQPPQIRTAASAAMAVHTKRRMPSYHKAIRIMSLISSCFSQSLTTNATEHTGGVYNSPIIFIHLCSPI